MTIAIGGMIGFKEESGEGAGEGTRASRREESGDGGGTRVTITIYWMIRSKD